MITAEIILDSISPADIRLTTFKLRYPKFIHGELMTHRVFSRNASSSRAVPISKSLQEARSRDLQAAPEYWGAEQKGMQSGGELPPGVAGTSRAVWNLAAQRAADFAQELAQLGVHKSIANRVLEPFLHINVLVTATEYLNFFGLRLDRAAQPEMRVLAERMWAAWNDSEPQELALGEWHMPFIEHPDFDVTATAEDRANCRLASAARCARISYESFETGKRSTPEEDLALANRLMASGHWSPFEHVATPDQQKSAGISDWNYGWWNPSEHGNFRGWRQLRKMLPNEAIAPLPEEYRK